MIDIEWKSLEQRKREKQQRLDDIQSELRKLEEQVDQLECEEIQLKADITHIESEILGIEPYSEQEAESLHDAEYQRDLLKRHYQGKIPSTLADYWRRP